MYWFEKLQTSSSSQWIDGASSFGIAPVLNHSEHPNCVARCERVRYFVSVFWFYVFESSQRFGGRLGVFIYSLTQIGVDEELTYNYRVPQASILVFNGFHSFFCAEPETACLGNWTPFLPGVLTLEKILSCVKLIVKRLPGIVLVAFEDLVEPSKTNIVDPISS
jgi:hypothetical protein